MTYALTNRWSAGFQADLTLRNTGNAPINGWTLAWSFANVQTITQVWNATFIHTGANVSASNLKWNATIPAGGSVGFGFTANWSGANAKPTAFSIKRRRVQCDAIGQSVRKARGYEKAAASSRLSAMRWRLSGRAGRS